MHPGINTQKNTTHDTVLPLSQDLTSIPYDGAKRADHLLKKPNKTSHQLYGVHSRIPLFGALQPHLIRKRVQCGDSDPGFQAEGRPKLTGASPQLHTEQVPRLPRPTTHCPRVSAGSLPAASERPHPWKSQSCLLVSRAPLTLPFGHRVDEARATGAGVTCGHTFPRVACTSGQSTSDMVPPPSLHRRSSFMPSQNIATPARFMRECSVGEPAIYQVRLR